MSKPTEPRDSREIAHWDRGAAATLEATRAGARVLALERASGGGGTFFGRRAGRCAARGPGRR